VGSTERKASVLLLTTFSTRREELCSFCTASDSRLDRIFDKVFKPFVKELIESSNGFWELRRAALHESNNEINRMNKV
jgi:hypothetical protein